MKTKTKHPSNKKVILVGFPSPIKLKSKEYVIRKIYEKSKRNPFLADSSYEEYLHFLQKQIKELGSVDVDMDSDCVEVSLYDALKNMKWLKVVNAFVVGIIEISNIGV